MGSVQVPRALETHRIDVWHVDLARGAEALLELEQQTPRLAQDDHHRAALLGRGDSDHPAARQRRAVYVAMRLVLEQAFGAGVRGGPITRSALGRPSISGLRGDFSLAHVADHALIAVVAGGSVGVDLERTRPVRMDARRQAAIERAAALLGVEAPLPQIAPGRFLMAWVRLEAYAKARHTGMARLLTAIGAMGGDAPSSTEDLARRLGALGNRDGAGLAQQDGEPRGGAHACVELATAVVRDLALPEGLFGAIALAGTGAAGGLQQPLTPRQLPDDLAGLRTVAP